MVFTAFLDLLAAYDSIPREKLWWHLQKIKTPQYLRDIIQTMHTGCLYLLIDGDKTSEEVAPNKGLKQGCPLSPLLYSLYTNDMSRPIVGCDDSCYLISWFISWGCFALSRAISWRGQFIDCCAETYTLQWQWFAMTDIDRFLNVQRGAATALDSVQVIRLL